METQKLIKHIKIKYIKQYIILILIAMIISVNIISDNHLYSQYDDSNYEKLIIETHDIAGDLTSRLINNYNKYNNIINSVKYVYTGNANVLYSNTEYVYDKETGLIKEIYKRSPNFSFIYKYSSFKSKNINGVYRNIEKRTLDYINTRIITALYSYNSENKIINEKRIQEDQNGAKLVYEKDYSYKEGKLINTTEYFSDKHNESGIYRTIYNEYTYDNNRLWKIKSYDKDMEPMAVSIFTYDYHNRISKKEIYKAEIVLSENDMFFERRYVKEKTLVYTYE